jgi:hypothetical protein
MKPVREAKARSRAMLCYATLRYDMLCYAMLCYACMYVCIRNYLFFNLKPNHYVFLYTRMSQPAVSKSASKCDRFPKSITTSADKSIHLVREVSPARIMTIDCEGLVFGVASA